MFQRSVHPAATPSVADLSLAIMMIRQSSANRVNITILSFPDTPTSAARPPPVPRGLARQQQQHQQRTSYCDSLYVALGLAVFLAAAGLFFLHRLQSSFGEEEELDQIHATFQPKAAWQASRGMGTGT